ncbi:MAG: hypothetical protein E6K56_04405 [Ignavibacteria bacterium]|nr:MAG: hypothetical protein E6K56_04405 [Ignavibacteria bacterium]
MKRLLMLLFACFVLAGIAKADPPYGEYGHHYGIRGSFGVFYENLSPYGEWIDFNFGYAWRPARVSHGWRPYLYGRWVWSDYGWYWVSDEPFGWAAYHYGRWYYDDYYGWIWIPDDTWGPAWVEWRYDDDYIGWAPLCPYASFDVRFGVRFTQNWVAPYNYWNFIPCRYIGAERVVDYVQPVERVRRVFGNTRSVLDIRAENDRIINRGIDPQFVERRANVRLDRVDVIAHDRAQGERLVRDGNRQRVEVFRPRLDTRIRSNDVRPPEARRAEHPISFDGPPNSRGQADGRFNMPDRSPDVRRDTRIQDRRSVERAPAEPQPDRRIENRNQGQRPPDVRRDTKIRDRGYQDEPRQSDAREGRVMERPGRPDPAVRDRGIDRPGRPDPGSRDQRQMREPPRREAAGQNREQQISRPPRQERPMPGQRPEMRPQSRPKPEPPRERGRDGRDGQRGGR